MNPVDFITNVICIGIVVGGLAIIISGIIASIK